MYSRLLKETATRDAEVWFEYAAVQLLAGDRQGYRRTCQQMLEGAAKAPKMRPYLVARAGTLAPDSVEDSMRLLQVSTQKLQQFAKSFWSLTEQGALNYRTNRFKEAVPLLKRSIQEEPKHGAAVVNWLWLALAYHKMGEPEEARRWLDKAGAWLDSMGNALPGNAADLNLHPHNWLEAHVLRREAETLLASASR